MLTPQRLDIAMRGLFDRLFDDAAMFPPGNADAATALSRHLSYREGALHPFVGPLLVPVDRWNDVAEAHAAAGSPAMDVVVLGTATIPRTVPGLHVVGVELLSPSLPLPPALGGGSVACEIRCDDDGLAVLDAIARAEGGFIGKFRTGGITAEAFPDELTLARVVVYGVRVGAPLKYTAGLHHAVRFRDSDTGFEHHGFLNLLVAAHAALQGRSVTDVAVVLGRRDAASLAVETRTWSVDDVVAVRRCFVCFGCCGVDEPVNDLVGLGLLSFPKENR